MINFNLFFSNKFTVFSLSEDVTMLELKANVMNIVDLEINDFNIFLGGFGFIEGCLDLLLSCFEFGKNILNQDKTTYYKLIVEKIDSPQKMWQIMCTSNILGKGMLMKQVGYRIGNASFCQACTDICRQGQPVISKITGSEIFCMCQEQKDEKCVFANSFVELDKTRKFAAITDMLRENAKEYVESEKKKLKDFEHQIESRNFKFESSIQFGTQRVQHYEDKSIQAKIQARLPLKDLEQRTADNMKISKLAYKDEFVKTLLSWFRNEFFSWCDQPMCKSCNQKGQYVDTQSPNSEEAKWLASRTEVYKCTKCSNSLRFARYNNPEKLLETQTGRCGEWANCFGAILRSFNYDVRFIDNFEDHVWNEYWSESLQRWVHVDSCETAWDTPLVYEQGWGRNMTYILAHSIHGVYDVTKRYVKHWDVIEKRRKKNDIERLSRLIEERNNLMRMNHLDKIDLIIKRDQLEICDLDKNKVLKEHEVVCRQSGSEEWRKERGEMK